jgi:heme/copper-type cytochrome/quinol oxidase subunit 3
MRHRVVADVRELPSYGFGPRVLTWWGTLGFVVLEATGFALAIGTYLYLAALSSQWPIAAPPPELLPGTLLTIVLLLSVVPNVLLRNWAIEQDLRKVRIGIIIMSALGLVPIAIRGWEIARLNVSWDANAYGSIVWTLLGLHTTHIVTDVADTLVLAALMFTRHADNPMRLSDVTDNVFYWNFVVVSWIPIYLLLYWFPRW